MYQLVSDVQQSVVQKIEKVGLSLSNQILNSSKNSNKDDTVFLDNFLATPSSTVDTKEKFDENELKFISPSPEDITYSKNLVSIPL